MTEPFRGASWQDRPEGREAAAQLRAVATTALHEVEAGDLLIAISICRAWYVEVPVSRLPRVVLSVVEKAFHDAERALRSRLASDAINHLLKVLALLDSHPESLSPSAD